MDPIWYDFVTRRCQGRKKGLSSQIIAEVKLVAHPVGDTLPSTGPHKRLQPSHITHTHKNPLEGNFPAVIYLLRSRLD
jgi:hypothetical protein